VLPDFIEWQYKMMKEANHSSTPIVTASQWEEISWVLLDMDGTLLDLCFDDTFWRSELPKAYAAHHQMSVEESLSIINDIASSRFGTLEWYCIDFWSDILEFDIRPTKNKLTHLVGFRNGALAFLKWLKHQNKHVILATNAHPDSIALKDTQTDLCQWVDKVMHAHDASAPKESQDYWHWLHKKTKFEATKALFIDDNDHILDAAGVAGIRYCIGVNTPNSMKPASESRYPAFDHFQELYPLSL
jgi:putative hydrolase of the HAD superfamily